MKKSALFLIAVCTVFLSFGQDVKARLDTILDTYAGLHKFNGSALIVKNGLVLLDKGYGYRNAADSWPDCTRNHL